MFGHTKKTYCVQATENFVYAMVLYFLMSKNLRLNLIRLQLIKFDCFQSLENRRIVHHKMAHRYECSQMRMFASTAVDDFKTPLSMATPCSVKA